MTNLATPVTDLTASAVPTLALVPPMEPPPVQEWLQRQAHPSFLPALACEALLGLPVFLCDPTDLTPEAREQIGPHNKVVLNLGSDAILCVRPDGIGVQPLPALTVIGAIGRFLPALHEAHPEWSINIRNGVRTAMPGENVGMVPCWIADVGGFAPDYLSSIDLQTACAPTPEQALLFAALLFAASDPDAAMDVAAAGERMHSLFAKFPVVRPS